MWDRRQAQEFMEQAEAAGSVLGLYNIRNLMEELGDVQDQLRVIHVAGTNGKGSVCAMLEQTLTLAGYRVGRYSSPEVFTYLEKYRVENANISGEKFLAVLEQVADACHRLEEKGLPAPTLFEVETATAFLWFWQKSCDLVLLETGLGGRLDATNVIAKPICSVITSVSMDHMGFLGNTLPEIAREKAGIIKEGCPVVSAPQKPEVTAVLEEVCRQQQTQLVQGQSQELSEIHYQDGFLKMKWNQEWELELSLLGAYQTDNALCVLHVLEELGRQGIKVEPQTIKKALSTTSWPGRFQVVNREPLVVLDGAHNEDAARRLRDTLKMGFTNKKLIYIIGVLADKDHSAMLKHMLPMAHSVYTITPDNPRGLDAGKLYQEVLEIGKTLDPQRIHSIGKVALAVEQAWQEASEDPDAMVVIFGSLSFQAQAKDALEKLGAR